MWGRKDQEQSDTLGAAERQPQPPPELNQPAPSAASTATSRTRSPTSGAQALGAAGRSTGAGSPRSRIGQSVAFKGEIHSEEDFFVDGVVEGMISIPKNLLVIGTNSTVKADVHAHSLLLSGRLIGQVAVVERIEIKKTGTLEGNLVTHRIVVEDGGIFRGSCDIKKPGEPARGTKRTQDRESVARGAGKGEAVRPPRADRIPVRAARANP